MFTDLELLKENMKEGKQVTLHEVLDIIKSTPACRTLIEGEGGIGKSTLLRYLAYNWANDSDKTFEGKIVLLINVRDIGKGEDILDVIVKQTNLKDFERKTNLSKDAMLITRFIIRHDDEIVLLLDGLDELEHGNICPISLFKKEELEDSIVILTSRSENIDEFIKESSVHVKVKGFDDSNIIKYIKKHFRYFGKPELGDSLVEELKLFEHQEVNSMCKNSMLLLSVCTMWEEKQGLPSDKADLFKEVFRSILNQFNKQEGNAPKITKFSDTPIEYVHAMLMLGKCMYKSLKRNQLSINSKDLEGNDEMVILALKLGFVYIDEPHSKTDFEQCFTAPHKLIVESLVGFYFSKQCQTAGLENKCADLKHLLNPLDESEWEIIRECEYLDMAKKFAIQFLGADVGKFFIHWMTRGFSTYRSLMKNYLTFVKAEHKVFVEGALIDHMNKTDLRIKPHVDDICKSLIRYIYHINPSIEVIEGEHFIKLTRKVYDMSPRPSFTQFVMNSDSDKLKPLFISLCNKMSSNEKCKFLAHILIAMPDETYMLQRIIPEVCSQDEFKCLTTEYQKLDLNYDILEYKIYKNTSITALFLVHLLTSSPKLTRLSLLHCITGDIMKDMIRELSSEVELELERLFINGNNLSTINGASLASLMKITPKLLEIDLSNCSLGGDVINDMISEFCGSIRLELTHLHISDNNFSTLYGSSLASLMSITPKLNGLNIDNCNLSGEIIKDMLIGYSKRGLKLELRFLNISGNNLSTFDDTLLTTLMCISPKLSSLRMNNCSLSGDVLNDMTRKFSSEGVKLQLEDLHISGNNLSTINASVLTPLLTIAPKLRFLEMRNSNLSNDVKDDIKKIFKSREGSFHLLL